MGWRFGRLTNVGPKVSPRSSISLLLGNVEWIRSLAERRIYRHLGWKQGFHLANNTRLTFLEPVPPRHVVHYGTVAGAVSLSSNTVS